MRLADEIASSNGVNKPSTVTYHKARNAQPCRVVPEGLAPRAHFSRGVPNASLLRALQEM